MATTDKFHKTGAATKTTLAAPGKALAATSINVVSTTNWPTTTQVTFAIRKLELVDGAYQEVAGSYAEFNGTVSGSTITNMSLAYGTDQVYPAGTTTEVFIPVSAYAHNRLIDGILVGHNQTGTHKAFAESAIVPTAAIQDSAVTTAKVAISNITADKLANGSHILEYIDSTTGQNTTSSALVDVTGLTLTFTTPASTTQVLLRAEMTISNTDGSATNTVAITNSANAIQVQRFIITGASNASALQTIGLSRRITVTPSTSYTFKLRFATSSGTSVLNQGSGTASPIALWVEKA
jgi:hypothetical protein